MIFSFKIYSWILVIAKRWLNLHYFGGARVTCQFHFVIRIFLCSLCFNFSYISANYVDKWHYNVRKAYEKLDILSRIVQLILSSSSFEHNESRTCYAFLSRQWICIVINGRSKGAHVLAREKRCHVILCPWKRVSSLNVTILLMFTQFRKMSLSGSSGVLQQPLSNLTFHSVFVSWAVKLFAHNLI